MVSIRESEPSDISDIVAVVNCAFAVEKFFIAKDRTHEKEIAAMRTRGIFLLAEEDGALLACVWLELKQDRAYFGLLSVDPSQQKRGLGRTLVTAVEDRAKAAGCGVMDIRVVNLRTELPPFYESLGYRITATEPFSEPEATSLPCHFLLMSKPL